MRKASKDGAHEFGGDWTTQKLKVLANYLAAYTTALQKQPFRKAYIDAFAGTGSRTSKRSIDRSALFPDLEAGILDGSARTALLSRPRFDDYVFIEQSQKRCRELERLRGQFPALASDIDVRRGEANTEIQGICAGNWRNRRAVLFLDPYGMQVEWATIEAIARTQAIDMWLLFPLGIGVNRLLTKSGEIPIGGYFNRRLVGVFAGVAQPGVLRNSVSNPMYLLCFAVGNPRGRDLALKIAGHLLKGMR